MSQPRQRANKQKVTICQKQGETQFVLVISDTDKYMYASFNAHLKHCHREWMHEVVVRSKHHLTILSVEVRSKNDMKLGINPKQTIAVIICNAKVHQHYITNSHFLVITTEATAVQQYKGQ